jgi:putative peptidoglycan lipid II flippase
MLHLLIQVPGLIKYKYKWEPGINILDKSVQRVLAILGPRLVTMLCIQLVFIVRDNMASRLETGSISALTYGWMFFQLPETLIGTAIGTAMLPSLAALAAKEDWLEFAGTIEKAIQTLLVLTIPVAFVLSVGLGEIVSSAFHFNLQQTNLIMWVTRGYLLGLAGQSVLEVAVRSYYARKDAMTPLIAAAINLIVYTVFAFIFSQFLGAVGISLADSLAFTSEAVLLLFLFRRRLKQPVSFLKTIPRGLMGGFTGALITAGCILLLKDSMGALLASIIGLGVGGLATLPIIWKELRQLTRL